MTQNPSTPPSRPPEPAASADAPRNPGRRLILGGIPIAVTLASKPALAMTGECSVSNALSGNLSHPLPSGVNCGLTPLTWCNLAGTNQLWPRTAMYPQTDFSSASGGPGFSSHWVCGTQSLLSALQGGLSIHCKINGTATAINAQLFGEQVGAGLLNAAAFSPNNFPQSLPDVQSMVRSIWATTPRSASQAQSALDAVTNQLAPLNINT
ncbi:MAG TPA: hypothetical protein VNF99_11275 [Stellaceae bacterium]|nr:hypothetical protein [Stellaceae bacterium]